MAKVPKGGYVDRDDSFLYAIGKRLGLYSEEPDPIQLVNPIASVLKRGQKPLVTELVKLLGVPKSRVELEALERAFPPGGKAEQILKRLLAKDPKTKYPPLRILPEAYSDTRGFEGSKPIGRYYYNRPEQPGFTRRRAIQTKIGQVREPKTTESRAQIYLHEFAHDIVSNSANLPRVQPLVDELLAVPWPPGKIQKYPYLEGIRGGSLSYENFTDLDKVDELFADIVSAYLTGDLPSSKLAPITNLVLKDFLGD